jgi:hypothetical protein
VVLAPGGTQPVDMGTRPTMTPRDMGVGTPYQDGLPWMYQPVASWLVRRDFTSQLIEVCEEISPRPHVR